MRLPRPVGVVPIRVTGGMSPIAIERPLEVAVGLEVNGGIGEVVVDGDSRKGAGRLSIQTPGADSAADRYEIEVSGGVNKVTISQR